MTIYFRSYYWRVFTFLVSILGKWCGLFLVHFGYIINIDEYPGVGSWGGWVNRAVQWLLQRPVYSNNVCNGLPTKHNTGPSRHKVHTQQWRSQTDSLLSLWGSHYMPVTLLPSIISNLSLLVADIVNEQQYYNPTATGLPNLFASCYVRTLQKGPNNLLRRFTCLKCPLFQILFIPSNYKFLIKTNLTTGLYCSLLRRNFINFQFIYVTSGRKFNF